MQTMWRAYQAREGPQTPLGLQHRGASLSCAQGGRSSKQPLCMHLQPKGLHAKRLPSASLAEVCDGWTSLQGVWQPPLYLLMITYVERHSHSLTRHTFIRVRKQQPVYPHKISCDLMISGKGREYIQAPVSRHELLQHLVLSTPSSSDIYDYESKRICILGLDRPYPSSSRTLLPNERTPDMSA